jgi:hypothetical protein
MSESMSNVERGLWRIAELGARCSQQSATGSREPLWAELEQTIARLDAEFEAARQAVDIAPAQVRSLEGRLNVAKKERDREKARADEHLADAEAARRERDRMAAKAAKAAAATAEARAAAGQAQAATADAEAKATAAQAALDQALTARNELMATLDETLAARDRVMGALDDADECIATLETRIKALETDLQAVAAERDAARAERDAVRADREALQAERDQLVAAQAAAGAERADALDALAARAEGAVVVLPGVDLPAAETGPAAPAARVAWRPTWSEWADEDDDDVVAEPAVAVAPVAATVPATVDVTDDVTGVDGDAEATVRYLNVAATIGQLLPDDLGPLLLAGATVVRREGRLFATVAVATNPWAASGADCEHQAEKLAEAGFRVEWTTDAPMAC